MSAKETSSRASPAPPRRPAGKAAPNSGGGAGADGRSAVVAALQAIAPPDQKRLARRLDQLILTALPGAVSGVKYRKPSQPLGVPFYGFADTGWLLHLNALKGRVRLTFFAGGQLRPIPPLPSPGGARAVDIPSEDGLDERQITAWLRQAKKLPGWGRI